MIENQAAAVSAVARGSICTSTETIDRMSDLAPGWDRYALESLYIAWAAGKDPARNEDARFLGWVKSYTKIRPPQ